MNRATLSGAAALFVFAAAGCSVGGDEPATTSPEPTPAEQSPSEPEPTSSPPAEGTAPMEELTGGEQNPTEAPPEWDEAAQREAADRAVAFMRAFARPDLSAEEWHAGIAGFMSDQGAEMFAYVDPANVPASQVTGEPEVLEEESTGTLAQLHVPTDAGTYLVTLTRVNQGDQWLVEYADPVD